MSGRAAGGDRAADRPEIVPVVGIGASAGGLEAFTELLGRLSPRAGMAYVLVQHLDPTHPSLLREVLARATKMPVVEATDGMTVERDHVYVTPPNVDIGIVDACLVVEPSTGGVRPHLPIDGFFRSLSLDRKEHAIGVVLSGSAADGTEGLRAIKAENGFTLVQDPATAKFSSMPQSAIAAGVVDLVLAIPALADELGRLGGHPYLAGRLPEETASGLHDGVALAGICAVVRRAVGVDFAEYKEPTFERRLLRRMALRQRSTYADYLALLDKDSAEVLALYEDALIHVTSFFRDPEAFTALQTQVFPAILAHKEEGAAVRGWVAGCSTGEEIYSIAIALLEFLRESGREDDRGRHIQLFGSDVSERAIERARIGFYPESALRDVSEDRRRRYFVKAEGGYRIHKSVRDLCVFVHHDLARDPPFSKLDFASCRNVLIYFDAPLQKRIVGMLHYCLAQPGFLLLGRSESIGAFAHLFFPIDKGNKIYARTPIPSTLQFSTRAEVHPMLRAALTARGGLKEAPRPADAARHLDRLLLSRYVPPAVLVNEKMVVVQSRGDTGAFLRPTPGAAGQSLASMARPGLMPSLRSGLLAAQKANAPVRTAGVEVDTGDTTRRCDLLVMPFAGLPDVQDPLFVVVFEEPSDGAAAERSAPTRKKRPAAGAAKADAAAARLPRLEHELGATKEYLEALIEEHGRATDELGSANEELISGNEELQSMNEELETAKEELQSTNEELTTVNDELRSRNSEVSRVNGDLLNLIDAVDLPVVILDMDRKVRRFTPRARDLMNLVATDVGRSLSDIRPNVEIPDLDARIAEVIRTMTVRESEVQDREGHWYRMQVRPYRTVEDRIDGAVMTLVDIDALKQHVRQAQNAGDEAERANRTKDQFLAVLSHELRTPLATMLMHAQLIRRGNLDATKLKRTGDAIERATRMQVQLIDDLLDVSRIVSGKLHMNLEPVDLRTIIASAVEAVSAQAKLKGVAIEVELEPGPDAVSGDGMRLQQVVANLLTNAIKFTPKGGDVTVLLDRVQGGGDPASGAFLRLRVRDTGMGIAESFLPRVFARFTQEDPTNSRVHGGLGLGLAIVRHIVECHGGTITAESPGPRLGSTFTVTIPAKGTLLPAGAPAPEPSAPRLPGDRGELNGVRVLVVEDDPNTRDAVLSTLREAGAEVHAAESAAEAMIAVMQFRPDVFVCDIAMPGEDGYSLVRRLRALPPGEGGDVPGLALTALAGVEDHRRALDAGFQMHLPKPFDIDRLTDAVVELVERAASPHSNRAAERPSKTP